MVSKLHCLQIAKTLFKKRQIRRGYFGGKTISKQIQNRDLVTLPAVWRYIIRTSRRRGRRSSRLEARMKQQSDDDTHQVL